MDTSLDAGVSDADLIAASLAEPGMFTAIFDRHAGEILRYVHSRLDGDLAQDVMAETFLAALRYRGRYDRARTDARPWLYGIAVRQIGKHRRAESRRLRLLRQAPYETPGEDPGDRAAERVMAEQLRPRVAAAARGMGWAELRGVRGGARPDHQCGQGTAAPGQGTDTAGTGRTNPMSEEHGNG